ncbi:MAG: DUF3536 domain-containing protein [Synergistales bacterium]|nr:DUF3536 domain-containing protein [Synergistales bacterium]
MRHICIHGHFYQPPRENPWLGAVLREPSAAPDHDWNSRITGQCYRPNRAARLVDSRGRIVSMVNNYRHLNFNFGPTLHRWLAEHEPVLAGRITRAGNATEADDGGGNAIAQAYNHMIMPLASPEDRTTQVRWGIADFRSRFGRDPAGMWLPETAADTPTLETLAAEGIRYTILAPRQCRSVTDPDGNRRETPDGAGLDTTRPYRVVLPSGREIAVVFYDGELAQEIAFGPLLDNGDTLARRLATGFPDREEPMLRVVATDGETFGHHHAFGEMALARAVQILSQSREAILTNIADYLDRYPPTWQAEIAERTSWSCVHGVERWRSNCGCSTGGRPGWHQRWRGPLRGAFDSLRARLDNHYSSVCEARGLDPWDLRNEAIALYLDHGGEAPEAFARRHLGEDAAPEAVRELLMLLEAQRMGMFMYTSCGWFFNDIAGVETAQVIAYALRCAELLRDAGGPDAVEQLRSDLAQAEGNRKASPTGAAVLEDVAATRRRTLEDVAASAFLLNREDSYYGFSVEQTRQIYEGGDIDLRLASLTVTDSRTSESWEGSAGGLFVGGAGEVCRLGAFPLPSMKGLGRSFYKGDLLETSNLLQSTFPLGPWKLDVLPPDDRETAARERLHQAERRWASQASEIAAENRRLLVQLHALQIEPPAFLQSAAAFDLKEQLEALLAGAESALELAGESSALEELLYEAHSMGLQPELSFLAPALSTEIHDMLARVASPAERDRGLLQRMRHAFDRAEELGIAIDLWRIQNEMWRILEAFQQSLPPEALELAGRLGFAVPDRQDTLQ